MADNIEVEIEKDGVKISEFKGRLIGYIESDAECKAVLNEENAAKKISTAESVGLYSRPNVISGARFVVVTKELMENEPHIFISPKIITLSYVGSKHKLTCEDKVSYLLSSIK